MTKTSKRSVWSIYFILSLFLKTGSRINWIYLLFSVTVLADYIQCVNITFYILALAMYSVVTMYGIVIKVKYSICVNASIQTVIICLHRSAFHYPELQINLTFQLLPSSIKVFPLQWSALHSLVYPGLPPYIVHYLIHSLIHYSISQLAWPLRCFLPLTTDLKGWLSLQVYIVIRFWTCMWINIL